MREDQISDREVREIGWYVDDTPDDEDGYSVREYDITASPNDFNIKSLFDFMDSGVIVIPNFQRNFVWDINRSSKLIESIIIGLPIPQIFLYEESKNKFLVIDGQQRLMSIYYFIKQRFPKREKRAELRRIFDRHGKIPDEIIYDDNYFVKFNLKLRQPESQKNPLHNLNYETLDELKFTFQMRTVRNIIIKQNLPDDERSSIYEVFNRLNTGGVNLRPQEIRSSLFHSDFYAAMYELNNLDEWRMLLHMPETDLHMKDIEIILRGFALLTDFASYNSSMQKFLNSFSRKTKNMKLDEIDLFRKIFIRFLSVMSNLGESPFENQRGKFNISLFDAVFYTICKQAYVNKNPDLIDIDPERFRRLKKNEEFNTSSLYASAGSSKITQRFEIAKEILSQ